MWEVVIEAAAEGRKGRSFRGVLLAYVEANALWEGGVKDWLLHRPVYAQIACSEGELAPLLANLRRGQRAEVIENGKVTSRFEWLKSAGYRFAVQRHPEGAVITAYLPDLVRVDAGMVDPDGVRVVLLPSRSWAMAQHLDAAAAVDHVMKLGSALSRDELTVLVPAAALLVPHLATRSRYPIPPHLGFWLQALAGALQRGLAASSSSMSAPRLGYKEEGTACIGLLPGVALAASHNALADLLASEVADYFEGRRRSDQRATRAA